MKSNLTNAFVIVSILISYQAKGQQSARMMDIRQQQSNAVNIASPVSSAFAKYIVNPVGYYTGVPSISIPLYNLKLRDFELPISLSYHAGGIKVEESGSNVGLGWSLSAGGTITRAIKDIPDDASIQYCSNSWYLSPGVSVPGISDFNYCGNGLLNALSTAANANYDGITSYDIDLSSFNGISAETKSMKLLKKFFGVAQFSDKKDIYLLPMADKEPDIFYYNFGGRSGQFVFDVSSGTAKIKTFPYQDLDIEYVIDGRKRLIGFKIKDEVGIIYEFMSVEESILNYRSSGAPVDDGYLDGASLVNHVRYFETGSGRKEFNSSWFLTKITTPLGDFLDFTYENEEYTITQRGPQQTGLYYIKPPTTPNYNPNDLTRINYCNSLIGNDVTLNTKRIVSIGNDEIKIDFIKGNPREDLEPGWRKVYTGIGAYILVYNGPYSIGEIVVNNKIGGLTRNRKFKLEYDYFVSDASEVINREPDNFNESQIINTGSLPKYYKRLRLRSIQEFGSNDLAKTPPFKFEYKYFDFTGVASHKLPHKLSYQQDLWGYYNGASGNNTFIPALYIYPDNYPVKDSRQYSVYKRNIYTGPEYYLPGANRLPNTSLSDIGVLTKVIYPTLGATSYEYESHVFKEEGEDFVGGGLRIKKVTKHDGANQLKDIVYNYTYLNSNSTSSGEIVSKPIFATRNTNFYGFIQDNNSQLAYTCYTTRFGSSQAPMGSTNGSYVGYQTVTEYIAGNGKTVFTYSIPATWQDSNDIPKEQSNGVCDYAVDGHCDSFYSLTPVNDIFVSDAAGQLSSSAYDFQYCPAAPNTFPFPENPNYDWQRGHLLREVHYDNSTKAVKETIYTYTNYFPSGKNSPSNVYGYKISNHYPLLKTGFYPTGYVFRVVKYKVLTEVAKVLKSKKDIIYDMGDPSKTVTSEAAMAYESPFHPNITQITSVNSKGKATKQILKYPEDFSNNEFGSNILKTRHMHGIPVLQTSYISDKMVKRNEKIYSDLGSEKTALSSTTEYLKDMSQAVKASFEYNEQLNIKYSYLQNIDNSTTVNVLNTSYLWGYNNTLPIAKTINANSTNVFYTSFEDYTTNITYVAKTGLKGYTSAYTVTLPATGTYILTYWQKRASEDWKLIKKTISSNEIIGETNSTIDEVRLYPVGARMTTYTYFPGIGMTSMTDENNNITYYEYDDLGKLKVVKDTNGNILKTWEYNSKL